ncbi:MAG TPA: hypothetical protein VKE98_05630 [Gemmataceae bacterium]|nr:hypothetical protein [Gemmataceae bacterium]
MTKNLLALGAAGLIAFVVVGWFLGWYHVQSVPTSNGREFKVDLNTPKITEDINKGKVKLEGILTKKPTTTNPTPPPVSDPPPITTPRVTIVPVTTQPGTTPDTFVLPGNPDNQGPQILPPPSVPPPLPPR